MLYTGIMTDTFPFCRRCSLIFSHQLRPPDADFRIIPGHTAFVIGMPEVVHLVAEFCHIGKNQEAMGKAFGNEKLFFIFFCQLHPIPLAIDSLSFYATAPHYGRSERIYATPSYTWRRCASETPPFFLFLSTIPSPSIAIISGCVGFSTFSSSANAFS